MFLQEILAVVPDMNILTARAMQLTRVDRTKFHLAISAGHYTCAPVTKKTKARRFDYPDLLGLTVFGRLLDMGVKSPLASEWACSVVELFRTHHTNLASVRFVRTFDGQTLAFPCLIDDAEGAHPQPVADAIVLEIVIPVERIMARMTPLYWEMLKAGEFQDDAE